MSARVIRVVLLLALVGGAACGRAAPPNVIIVLVDTLRLDRLGAYGNPHGLTPAIDALAGQGTVFRHAYAQSSWTSPSVASLFTSRFPSQHQVISFTSTLDDREQTLAEILHARGYATAGFVANVLLQQRLGYGQGFDLWKVVTRPNPAAPPGKMAFLKGRGDGVNHAVFAWLDGRGDRRAPVFLYVHYMEAHAPFDPPDAAVAAQRDGAPPPDRAAVNHYMELPMNTMPDSLLPDAWALYNAEVASGDAEIGHLLDGLRARGVLDDAVIVFLADHGEEFKEHGLMGHHQTLYEEVIRVPLVIATTKRPEHRDVDDLVSVIDVAPTVLDLIGGDVPPQFEGRSRAANVGARPWWTAFRPSPPEGAARPVFSELLKPLESLQLSPHERAVVSGETKLIAGVGGERIYYDLRADPGETNPDGVAPEQRPILNTALAQLLTIAASEATPTAAALDDETRERMRALGYAE